MLQSLPPPSAPVPLWQSSHWAAILQNLGRPAGIERLGTAGRALVLSRHFGPFGTLRFTSRGPLWQPDTPPQDQITALRASRLTLLNAEGCADDLLRRAGYLRLRPLVTLAWLPTAPDLEGQLALASGTWRNAARGGLRRTGRGPLRLSLRPFHAPAHDWLFAADRAQQRTRGYRGLPAGLIRRYAARHPGDTLVAMLSESSTPIAALLILIHGTSATWQIGWTNEAGRAARAHHALLARSAVHLAGRGVTALDLGLAGASAPPGIARFKAASGATLTTTAGTWLRRPRLGPVDPP